MSNSCEQLFISGHFFIRLFSYIYLETVLKENKSAFVHFVTLKKENNGQLFDSRTTRSFRKTTDSE
jgi:hypothetical protein